jgi:hypothetical protein
MTNQELTDMRVRLYKATPLKLQLVDELISLIKGCFGNNIETNGIQFDRNIFKLGGLYVRMIEIDPHEFGGILVHWYQKLDISVRYDPYCSVYMLSLREIRKIIEHIKSIHEHYENSIVVTSSPIPK